MLLITNPFKKSATLQCNHSSHLSEYSYEWHIVVGHTDTPLPSRGYQIHWVHLSRGVRPPNECPAYDTKQSDGEVPVMLGFGGMRRTPSLSLLPGPLWPGVVAPHKRPIYGLNRTKSILMLNRIVWLNWIAGNRNVFDD